MYCNGGLGVESGKVLLYLSEEVQQDQRGGRHTHFWPGQVVEVTYLTLPTALRRGRRPQIAMATLRSSAVPHTKVPECPLVVGLCMCSVLTSSPQSSLLSTHLAGSDLCPEANTNHGVSLVFGFGVGHKVISIYILQFSHSLILL